MKAVQEEFPLIPDVIFLAVHHMSDLPSNTLLCLMPPTCMLATVPFAVCCINCFTAHGSAGLN